MRVTWLDGARPEEVRALLPSRPQVEEEVRAIIEEVRRDGDAALLRWTERLDGVGLEAAELRVPGAQVERSLGAIEPGVLDALRTAIANVRALLEAQLRPTVVTELAQGQRIEIEEVPVRRAGLYVPAGRAPYPSTAVMLALTARVAGVEEVALCTPPGPEGRMHPVILAACALCGVSEVYRMGGVQAFAALAHGTESVPAADVIAGPGTSYVQEAKRQVVGRVGIDGIQGPSELVVVATEGADAELVALDLLAQAEHGTDSLLAVVSPDHELLEAVGAAVERLAPERPSVKDAPLAVVSEADAEAAVRLADGIAPEHLQLVGAEAEALAPRVRAAGCLFVGAGAGTAFGDYVAGSNHVLPTGGAARFQSTLSAATFRRRMARVSLPDGAPARLAPAGAALARAEGFHVHAESMERRAGAGGSGHRGGG